MLGCQMDRSILVGDINHPDVRRRRSLLKILHHHSRPRRLWLDRDDQHERQQLHLHRVFLLFWS